ncbi:MAG: flagellar hook-length control protein FliK [Comamonadaceae bacterium]
MIADISPKGGVAAVLPVTAARFVTSARSDAQRLLPPYEPGDILTARVEAKLPGGDYKVLLDGQPMRMTLPSFIAPGDNLELAFVSRQPRLTFELRSAVPLASGAAPSLSVAGRLVAATMLASSELAKPIGASAPGPLLAAAPTDGAKLSGELARTFADTGLFYESHQAQWVAGTRSLTQIMQEPQARLTHSVVRDAQTIAPQTLPLVQQQLAALDTSTVLMQVEIWPRQWMQWAVNEQSTGSQGEGQGQGQVDPQPVWNTQIRLKLPRLGELNATLSLADGSIGIRLEAASAASAALLQDHCAALQQALVAAGLPSSSIAVTHHEQS